MKQYVIDQLRESDYDLIFDFLDTNAENTVMREIFHLNLPEHLYSELQSEHTECQPYYFAVNLTRKRVAFEWLIRSHQRLRCSCIGYATPKQRDYIIDFADHMLKDLNIRL